MKIVYYSNCQCDGLYHFINKKIKHDKNHIENYSLIKQKKPIPEKMLKDANIFIYQPIDAKHGKYSTDESVENNIMTHLPEDCKKISFPYIYNSALWVLIEPAHIDGFVADYPDINKYINREPIEKLKKEGLTLNEVINMYNNGNIDFEYESRMNKSIKVLKEKEEKCDIKISNFIVENIRKHRLFLTQNHPTSCIFAFCANQVLKLLGCEYQFDVFNEQEFFHTNFYWKHTSYDNKYWKFEFDLKKYIDDKYYIKHIERIYNNYKV